jgi:hypothetical protein
MDRGSSSSFSIDKHFWNPSMASIRTHRMTRSGCTKLILRMRVRWIRRKRRRNGPPERGSALPEFQAFRTITTFCVVNDGATKSALDGSVRFWAIAAFGIGFRLQRTPGLIQESCHRAMVEMCLFLANLSPAAFVRCLYDY